MVYVEVFNEQGTSIISKRFKTFDRATDYCADVVGNMIQAAKIRINNNGEDATLDCWELRDKAIANGYELPVHRQMLAHL